MYRSIMVPLDGFPTSERALPVAARLARQSGAKLHLVHVLDLLVFPPYAGDGPTPEWWNGRAIELAHDYLQSLVVRTMIQSGTKVSAEVLQEPIAPSLLEYAQKNEVDLIIMTTHGRSPMRRFWLGSVADQLARSSICPTLFLRAAEVVPVERAADPFKHILVTLDGSRLSEGVLPVALELARLEGATLTLLNVLDPQPVAVPVMSEGFGLDLPMPVVDPRVLEKDRREYLDLMGRSAQELGIRAQGTMC